MITNLPVTLAYAKVLDRVVKRMPTLSSGLQKEVRFPFWVVCDLARTKVEEWRERYAVLMKEAGERLSRLDSVDQQKMIWLEYCDSALSFGPPH